MLSFSTRGSSSGSSVSKVIEALRQIRICAPRLAVDGEYQFDTALISDIAIRKMSGDNAITGKANVLIFPDLNAGNLAYKVTQYMAHARAIGPVLQGFAKPVSDLSRGASVDDILATVVLTLSQVKPKQVESWSPRSSIPANAI